MVEINELNEGFSLHLATDINTNINKNNVNLRPM